MDHLISRNWDLVPSLFLSLNHDRSTDRGVYQTIKTALIFGCVCRAFNDLISSVSFCKSFIYTIKSDHWIFKLNPIEELEHKNLLICRLKTLDNWMKNDPKHITHKTFDVKEDYQVLEGPLGLELLSFGEKTIDYRLLENESEKFFLEFPESIVPPDAFTESCTCAARSKAFIAAGYGSIILLFSNEKKFHSCFRVDGQVAQLHLEGEVLFVRKAKGKGKASLMGLSVFYIETKDELEKLEVRLPSITVPLNVMDGFFYFEEKHVIFFSRDRCLFTASLGPLIDPEHKGDRELHWIAGPSFSEVTHILPCKNNIFAVVLDDKDDFELYKMTILENEIQKEKILERTKNLGHLESSVYHISYFHSRLFIVQSFLHAGTEYRVFSYDIDTKEVSSQSFLIARDHKRAVFPYCFLSLTAGKVCFLSSSCLNKLSLTIFEYKNESSLRA